ncbi:MAG: hypothetical protein GY834_06500 [Bacteroidetes bacterium]|nr:hypothetical protein [Bacteroidota bacterium]
MNNKKILSTKLLSILITFLFINNGLISQKIHRIDPPNWWVGMENMELQPLLYGNNITKYDNSLSNNELLKYVVLTDNLNYIFLNLNIPSEMPTGEFSNRDPSNDNIDDMLEKHDRKLPDGRHGGNIQEITDHLSCTNLLKINTLWVNPLLKNDIPTYSYHGYAITDHYTLVFGDNHDLTRLLTNYGGNVNKLKMAMVFLLTTHGIPNIYFGTEILMEGNEHDGHGKMRKDFQGGWPNNTQNAFVAEGRSIAQNDMTNFMSTMLNWRKNKTLIHEGELTHFIPQDDVYVYFRHDKDESVMIIRNNNKDKNT